MRPVSRQGAENENGDSMFRTFAAAAALATLPLQASALSVTFESTLGDLQTAIGGPAPVIDDYSTFPPTGYTFSGSFSHDATNEIVTAIGGPANGGETTLTFDSPIGFFAVDTLNLSDNEIVEIIISDGSDTASASISGADVAGFLAFTSDMPFTSVVLNDPAGGTNTRFAIDNLRAGDGPTEVIPLPATLPLLLGAIGVGALVSRRRA